jgi:hypothetical protein
MREALSSRTCRYPIFGELSSYLFGPSRFINSITMACVTPSWLWPLVPAGFAYVEDASRETDRAIPTPKQSSSETNPLSSPSRGC